VIDCIMWHFRWSSRR